jgi:DNA-binding MarR family transcriptional regulator
LFDLVESLYSHIVLAYYKKLFTVKEAEINKLSATDMSLLEIIFHMKKPNYSELSRFVNMSLPNLTYRINRLMEKGYVLRTPDEQDKRKHYLEVTEKFIQIYSLNDRHLKDIMQNISNSLSGEELAVAEKIMRRMNEYYMNKETDNE